MQKIDPKQEAINAGRGHASLVLPGTKVVDTDFESRPIAYVVLMEKTSGVVIYEDEPGCTVAVGNRPGRFVDPPKDA